MKKTPWVATAIVLFAIVGCGGSDDPASTAGTSGSGGASGGSGGAAGTGGSSAGKGGTGGMTAGAGGSTAGAGGTTAGAGGTTAGAGGSTSGAGGSTSGAGGTTAGAGGTTAGAGGTTAGAGGTTAGAGGSTAGAGGSTAGSAGMAGMAGMTMCGAAGAGGAVAPPCNTLVNSGTTVDKTVDAGATPVGTGGTITDGLYHLTELRAYAGSPITMFSESQTLEMSCGGTFGQFVNKKATGEFRSTFTTSVSGTAPGVKTICSTNPGEIDLKYSSFTATPTSFTLYSATFAFSATFTKP